MTTELNLVAQRMFTEARSHGHWLSKPVSVEQLQALYEMVKYGPTSMNCQPMRLRFVVSTEARERLAACVNAGNVDKVKSAPVVVVLGQDMAFAERLPVLFAHKADAQSYYEGKPDVVASTALRNSSLQGGYLILAARLLGLDCGPMSGFKPAEVDQECWQGTTVRTNFMCCLGYGDASKLKPRNPRLSFDEACSIV